MTINTRTSLRSLVMTFSRLWLGLAVQKGEPLEAALTYNRGDRACQRRGFGLTGGVSALALDTTCVGQSPLGTTLGASAQDPNCAPENPD
jgi:hypothetical protein